jgi:hypothetical protein
LEPNVRASEVFAAMLTRRITSASVRLQQKTPISKFEIG